MLKIKSYKEAAYDEIKERIISGAYKPGEVLNERELSKDFGISRTPIREALQKLSFEGWILNEPNKKNEVRNFDLDYIIQTQKVRAALEILAIQEAFDNINDEDIMNLESILKKQKSAKDYNEFIKIDRDFHEFIYKKSKNQVLLSLMDNINDIVRHFGLLALDMPGRTKETIKEHTELLNALKNKDKKITINHMEKHMEKTLEAMKTGSEKRS